MQDFEEITECAYRPNKSSNMECSSNISSEASVIFHNVNEIFHLFGKLCSRYIRPFKYVNTAPQHITQ